MGGSRQSSVPAQSNVSGTIDVRFHESGGNAHFHDDANQAKVEVPMADWSKAQQDLEAGLCEKEFKDVSGAKLVAKSFMTNGQRDVSLTIYAPEFKSAPMSDTMKALSQFTFGT